MPILHWVWRSIEYAVSDRYAQTPCIPYKTLLFLGRYSNREAIPYQPSYGLPCRNVETSPQVERLLAVMVEANGIYHFKSRDLSQHSSVS